MRYENPFRTRAEMPRLRKTYDDEFAFGRQIRRRRRLASRLRTLRTVYKREQKRESFISRTRRRNEHPGYNQISVLAVDCAEQKRALRLYQYGFSVRHERNKGAVAVFFRRYCRHDKFFKVTLNT